MTQVAQVVALAAALVSLVAGVLGRVALVEGRAVAGLLAAVSRRAGARRGPGGRSPACSRRSASTRADGLYWLYALLPVAVSFVAEQLRVTAAETVLHDAGLENAQAVGELDEARQRSVVLVDRAPRDGRDDGGRVRRGLPGAARVGHRVTATRAWRRPGERRTVQRRHCPAPARRPPVLVCTGGSDRARASSARPRSGEPRVGAGGRFPRDRSPAACSAPRHDLQLGVLPQVVVVGDRAHEAVLARLELDRGLRALAGEQRLGRLAVLLLLLVPSGRLNCTTARLWVRRPVLWATKVTRPGAHLDVLGQTRYSSRRTSTRRSGARV